MTEGPGRPPRVYIQLAILVLLVMAVAWESDVYPIEHQITYHETSTLAADFSAFYGAAWALVHNPGRVYENAYYPVPYSQSYVYPPFFLLFVYPLLALPFTTAELVFSAFQFALLPLIAILVCLILRPRSEAEYGLTAVIVELSILDPFDARNGVGALLPQAEQYLPLFVVLPFVPYLVCEAFSTRSRRTSVACGVVVVAMLAWLVAGRDNGVANYVVLSAPYGTQWILGQSKVLQLFLIFLALWLAEKRPVLSAPVLLLSAFDPRFAVLALPAYLYTIVKGRSVLKALEGGAVAGVVLFVPFAVYHGILGQYVTYILTNYLSAGGSRSGYTFYLFDYEYLLLYSIVAVELGLAVLGFARLRRESPRFADRAAWFRRVSAAVSGWPAPWRGRPGRAGGRPRSRSSPSQPRCLSSP